MTRIYRGRIAYLRDGRGELGREWFTVSVSGEQRTVRAYCEMDDVALMRDVTYTVDAAWRPLDAFVRLGKAGGFVGASAFWFDERGVDCEGFTALDGRFTQRVHLPRRATLFAPHPLVTDGWQAAAFDFSGGVGRQRLEWCTNSSPEPDGGTGPNVGVVYKDLEYCGDERVTVAAGTFLARRMKIHPLMNEMADWPPLEFWVAGTDFLMVRMRWDLLESTYELVELSGDAR
jgi:hypothetical protein